jgi:hypothetical protein
MKYSFNPRTKGNWCIRWVKLLNDYDMVNELNLENICYVNKKMLRDIILHKNRDKYVTEWKDILDRKPTTGLQRGNKLRTYATFKSQFETESYIETLIPYRDRKALSQFRLGIAPIAVELGRHRGIVLKDRLCEHCENFIEDEEHVITKCALYDDIRHDLYVKAIESDRSFQTLSDREKLCFLMSNHNICRDAARACNLILERRRCQYL